MSWEESDATRSSKQGIEYDYKVVASRNNIASQDRGCMYNNVTDKGSFIVGLAMRTLKCSHRLVKQGRDV